MSALPPEAYGAALAAIPGMGPARLRELLDRRTPAEAWTANGDGRVEVGEQWHRYQDMGVAVHLLRGDGYPVTLAEDHEAPAVLFSVGDLTAIDGPRVAIIGSRRCTRYGRDVAFDLGRDLARVGARVVSGLALGIDGAAHLGVLAAGDGAAPPVAVVGSGLDVVYPRAHGRLWKQVGDAGVVLSEAPLGARPEGWRFPARNRILAALADVVVVVESRAKGGSFHTVQAADQRGVPVMAVPGPVRSPASSYTNELLATGSPPARDVDDVLVALDLIGRGAARPRTAGSDSEPPSAVPDDPHQAALLEALGWQPASLDQLVVRAGLSPGQASVALARLEVGGWVVGQGGWWEQVRKQAPAK